MILFCFQIDKVKRFSVNKKPTQSRKKPENLCKGFHKTDHQANVSKQAHPAFLIAKERTGDLEDFNCVRKFSVSRSLRFTPHIAIRCVLHRV